MSLYTIRSGVTNHPEETFLQHLTDTVRAGGVIDPETDFLVEEPAGGGRNVDIAAGHAFVKGSTGSAYPIRNTATITEAINANASGNPRITAVVLYNDLSATPGATDAGDDVAVIATVDGTPGASPVAPSDSEIQSTIGASNPFIRLANVTVASGATGISNSDIQNVARKVHLRSSSPIVTDTYASPLTVDVNESNYHKVVMSGNLTLSEPDNMLIGDWLILELVQDATGSRAVTWFSTIDWMSPDTTLATGANQKTVYLIQKIADGQYMGYLSGKDY